MSQGCCSGVTNFADLSVYCTIRGRLLESNRVYLPATTINWESPLSSSICGKVSPVFFGGESSVDNISGTSTFAYIQSVDPTSRMAQVPYSHPVV